MKQAKKTNPILCDFSKAFCALLLFAFLFNFSKSLTGQTFNEKSAASLSDKGKEQFLLGNFSEAIEYFNAAIKIQPQIKEVNYMAGLAQYNSKEYEKAIPYFSAELKNNHKNLNCYLYRGISKSKIGQSHSALRDLKKAKRINKTNELVYLERADIYFQKKMYKKAIAEYDAVIHLNPKLELGYYKKGFCCYHLKDISAACENWRKIADLDDFEGYQEAEKILNENTNAKK